MYNDKKVNILLTIYLRYCGLSLHWKLVGDLLLQIKISEIILIKLKTVADIFSQCFRKNDIGKRAKRGNNFPRKLYLKYIETIKENSSYIPVTDG